MNSDNPILNSPYEEPELHYATNNDGSLNYNDIRKGRRIFTPDINAIPSRQGSQGSLYEMNDYAEEYGTELANLIRKEIEIWRLYGFRSHTIEIKHPNQKIAVRVVSQFGEESTKVVGVKS